MYRSEQFVRDAHKALAGADNKTAHIEQLFVRLCPPSGELTTELFHTTIQDSGDDERAVIIQRLGDFVDLLWMEYDDQADPLGRDEWELIKDLVDEHALELDMQLVQYIMERVVSHDALE